MEGARAWGKLEESHGNTGLQGESAPVPSSPGPLALVCLVQIDTHKHKTLSMTWGRHPASESTPRDLAPLYS